MKNLIRRWLGFPPVSIAAGYPIGIDSGGRDVFDAPGAPRNTFEVIKATNGHVVVFRSHIVNPNGPDKHTAKIYLVPEGEELMPTITTALVAASLS